MRGRDASRRCARALSLGNKEYRRLRDDDDETSKTIGQTGLTTTQKRKVTEKGSLAGYWLSVCDSSSSLGFPPLCVVTCL